MLIDLLAEELRQLGADVRVEVPRAPSNDRHETALDLRLGDVERRFVVEERGRAPYPSELHQLQVARERIGSLGIPLLLAPYISESLGASLIGLGWSWADGQGNCDLAASPLRLRSRVTKRDPVRPGLTFPRSAAGLRIVRALIGRSRFFTDRLSQARLAAAAGVTQARVSQIVAGLRAEGLVSIEARQLTFDPETLWEAFLERYEGPGGLDRHRYTLDPLNEAALRLVRNAPFDAVAISADVATDLVAPARRPTHLIVYCRTGSAATLDFGDDVPVDTSEQANVTVREPSDDSVFGPLGLPTTALVREAPVRLVDATQIVWDTLQLGGRDRLEATEALKRWMLSNSVLQE